MEPNPPSQHQQYPYSTQLDYPTAPPQSDYPIASPPPYVPQVFQAPATQPVQPPLWTHHPYSQPVPPPLPKKNRRTLWIILGIVGGALIACFVFVGVAAALSPNKSANGSLEATSGSTATPMPTSTPIPPTPTTDPQIVEAANYAAAILPPMQTLQNGFTQVGTDCGNQNIVACRSNLEKVISGGTTIQTALSQNPAPACLKSVDKQIRSGLVDYKNGAYLAVRGIDGLNASEINAGTAEMDSGNTAFSQAATGLRKAKC
jgi:hypothetical protein